MNHQKAEFELHEHLAATDDMPILENYKWPVVDSTVVSLGDYRNPEKHQSFRGIKVSDLPEQIGQLTKKLPFSSCTMRFLVVYKEDGHIDAHYMGFDFLPLSMLSCDGSRLERCIDFYRDDRDALIMHASGDGHFWMCDNNSTMYL